MRIDAGPVIKSIPSSTRARPWFQATMTLYYSIVFALLVFEMAMFMVLIVPLPFSARRKLFQFLATSEVVAKINYGVRITFIFVAVLFIDAFQRMMKVTAESQISPEQKGFADLRSETNYHAKKFYAQRNVYLTGFTLFLSLILARTYSLVLDLINAQEELASTVEATGSGDAKEKQKIDALRKQVEQQQQEYNRLSDELALAKGEVGDKKFD